MSEVIVKSPPKCGGIGLGRTGTTSLCEALQLLGYKNVQHNPDFPELKTLDGGADVGVLIFYKYLDYKFPGSKFVLTLRDLEEWLRSEEYIFSQIHVRALDDDVAITRAGYRRHIEDVRRYFAEPPGPPRK